MAEMNNTMALSYFHSLDQRSNIRDQTNSKMKQYLQFSSFFGGVKMNLVHSFFNPPHQYIASNAYVESIDLAHATLHG